MTRAVFFRHFAGDPFFNMAVDEWLLWQVSFEPGLVYLRLYTWQSGAITFGVNQKKQLALDFSKVSDTPVIRRVTGGRALYHDPGELTYSIAVNSHCLDDVKLAASLSKTSASIAEALTRFLYRLGIPSHYLRRSLRKGCEPALFHSAACFDSVARYEVVAKSQKIVASAQRRIGATFLQHGSMKLHGVASHPALAIDALPGSSSFDLQPITREELSSMASLFVQEVGLFFGLAFEERNLSRKDYDDVKNRAAFLKKNPLSRRDIFEHWSPVSSLYDNG